MALLVYYAFGPAAAEPGLMKKIPYCASYAAVSPAKQHHSLVIAREQASRDAIDHARHRAERLAAHSYDLRTPLASLLGLLDVEEQLPKQQVLPLLRNSSERLLALLQEYSDREQADSGDIFLHESGCNLVNVVTEEVASFRRKLLSSGQAIDMAVKGDSQTYALIDPLQLRQLVKLMIQCGQKPAPNLP